MSLTIVFMQTFTACWVTVKEFHGAHLWNKPWSRASDLIYLWWTPRGRESCHSKYAGLQRLAYHHRKLVLIIGNGD